MKQVVLFFAVGIMAVIFSGCATVIQSQRVLNNVDLSFVAFQPTGKYYAVGDRAYVEFAMSRYTDHMPLWGEDIHDIRLTRDPKSPSRLVYLEIDGSLICENKVLNRLSSNKVELIEAACVPPHSSRPLTCPEGFLISHDAFGAYWLPCHIDGMTHGYPVPADVKRGFTGYVVAPLQVPAFILDVGVTIAALPVGLVNALFQ